MGRSPRYAPHVFWEPIPSGALRQVPLSGRGHGSSAGALQARLASWASGRPGEKWREGDGENDWKRGYH